MGKRQRTPHFVTGLGDGHVGGTTADSSKVANKKALHLTGLRHPTAKVHAAAATDDIFHVTEHVRRNNNNNNRNPRLRSAAATTNERLARMDMDDGRESRWDMMFTSSSGDGKHSHRHGKAGNSRGIGNNNPLLHPTEQWQMSAIALVCMLVFLSALFLHMVSSDTSSAHGSSGSADLNSKNHRRIPRRRDNKRKVSLGTRKKDERYWSSDEYEEGSEVDNHNATDSGVLIPRGVVTVDSDGGQASTAALTPNNNSGSNKTVLHYPYQPRHRKPSVTGHKETFATGGAATSYSPAAKPRNYYHLNPMDGPVVPSYQTPVAAKAQLHVGGNTTTAAPAATATAASPSHLAYPATPSQQHQQSPYLQQSPYNGTTPKARTSNPMMSPGRSPAAAKNTIAASTLDTSNEFIATGLESFHPNPPVNDATANGVGTTTPQVQRKPHQTLFSTPARATNNTDEDCQKQHSTTSATSSPHIPHLHSSAAMNSPTANTDTMHRQQGYNNNNNNNGPVYGQSMSFEVVSGNNISSTSNTNSQPQQFQNQQHQSFSNQYSGGTPGNSMGYGILSPRVEADISDLEETPRAGFARRTVAIGDHHNYSTNPSLMMKQQQQQQEAYQVFSAAQEKPHQQYQQFQSSACGSSSSNRDDPFQALRLPVVPVMGSTAQNRQQLGGTTPNFSIPHQPAGQQQQQQQQRQLQQNEFNMPFIPKLDLAVAAAMASSSQQQIMSNGAPGIAPPRSMSVEELHLVQMESGTHWKVNSGLTNENADVVTALPGGASDNNSNSKSRRKSTTNPFHASAGLGNSDELWSVASSSADDADDSGAADGPRNSIIHKRDNMTADTNAASSLRSSIKFDELKLDEVIGGGGFGQVWKADWRGTPVAVKVLTGSAQAKRVPKAILEEFAAEINLLSGMRHPNVCLYMGACVDPPNRAIITELAANGSLWDALRLPLNPPFSSCDGVSRDDWPSELYDPGMHGFPPSSTGSNLPPIATVGSWPWALVKHVALGAARGMAYLHSGNPPILHRDLKSANILLNESYTAKVCDFGLSRLKAQERSMTGNCGTVQWMAVEVLAQQSYGEKADVYSYGIICIELLTRECPYDGMSAIQCALAVLNRDQRPEIPRWCPPPLRALIKACIKKDPDERPTFSQVISALDAMP